MRADDDLARQPAAQRPGQSAATRGACDVPRAGGAGRGVHAPGAHALEGHAHPDVATPDWDRWGPSVSRLYAARGFAPLWFQDGALTRPAIALVDELYDRNVKLLLSAAASPAQLYAGEKLKLEFQRTASRLTEMQSQEYLARPHKA